MNEGVTDVLKRVIAFLLAVIMYLMPWLHLPDRSPPPVDDPRRGRDHRAGEGQSGRAGNASGNDDARRSVPQADRGKRAGNAGRSDAGLIVSRGGEPHEAFRRGTVSADG